MTAVRASSMYRSRGERDDRAATYDDDAAVPDAIDDRGPGAAAASPSAARATAQRFTAACAARPRRAEAASPIYPTPKFSTKAEPAEKFGAPIKGADGNQSGSAPRAQD